MSVTVSGPSPCDRGRGGRAGPPAGGDGPDRDGAGVLPLVDSGVLCEFARELDDPITVGAFISDYVSFWDERFLRVASSLSQDDLGAGLEAVMNLRAVSVMIGALRLSALASEVESLLREGQVGNAHKRLPVLEHCGCTTMEELRTTYLQGKMPS